MKTVGLLIIFLCPLSVGAFSSHKTKTSLVQLKAMLNFINYIKSQIEYFNTPLNDIYSSYENDNVFLNEFVINISAFGWSNALLKTPKIYLSNDTIQKLSQFGSFLGKSNKEEQITHCDYYIKLLEEEYKNLEKEAPQKTKVSLALGLFCGLMLVILLI